MILFLPALIALSLFITPAMGQEREITQEEVMRAFQGGRTRVSMNARDVRYRSIADETPTLNNVRYWG